MATSGRRHYMRGTLAQRLFSRVKIQEGGCLEWTGCKNYGYGHINLGRKGANGMVHRLSYEMFVGPIPEGMVLDHLCRNRARVNPDHLEVVSRGENAMRGESVAAKNARKTHCIRGHELTEGSYYLHGGTRVCKRCVSIRNAAQRAIHS